MTNIATKFVKSIRFTAAVLSIFLLTIIAFYSGVEWGVKQWIYLNSPVYGMFHVRTLQALRSGDVKMAIDLEELQLNLRVLEHWNNQPGWLRLLWTEDMNSLAAQLPKAGSLIIGYRKQYPLDFATSDVQSEIVNNINNGLLLLERGRYSVQDQALVP